MDEVLSERKTINEMGGNIPRGNFLEGGIFRGGIFQGGSLVDGNFPWGNLPRTLTNMLNYWKEI